MKSSSKLVNVARQGDSVTKNGALTNSTSLNSVVDMFFLAGASRNMSPKDMISLFVAAFVQNPLLAIKCLFWSRDIRGGAGERIFFQNIMKYVKIHYEDVYNKVIRLTPEYGYWKDILQIEVVNPEILMWMAAELNKKNGLLAKWLPRKGEWFNGLCKTMKKSPRDMRKLLVELTKVVEQQMCANDWTNIEFSHVPSIAFNNYKKAFERHDETRFKAFLESAVKGEVKVNASAIFPYTLYQSYRKGENSASIIAQWNNLPNYVKDGESFIPVCDVSGSMDDVYGKGTVTPMDISISLGVYLSERNKSIFKDAFITFSTTPTMEYLKGNVVERFAQLRRAHWAMSTNLQAVFTLILGNAVRAKLSSDDLPTTIVIISDMEFNGCVKGGMSVTNHEGIESQYKAAGYKVPKVVFWNVNGRMGNVPTSANAHNVALVSGASPAIVQSILGGEDFTPESVMLKTLEAERYSQIVI